MHTRSMHFGRALGQRNKGLTKQSRMSTSVKPTAATQAQEAVAADDLKDAGPAPKRFNVSEGQLLNIASAAFPALLRLGSGGLATGYSISLAPDDGGYAVAAFGGRKVVESSRLGSFKRPALPLQLYEFQSCPFCRKVREAVSILGLEVEVFPCPKDGSVWRPAAVADGGKAQFPFLKDPNTGKSMYESDAIISYLFQEYGDGQVPLALRLGLLTTLTCGLSQAPRGTRGLRARPSKQPAEPLVLWGYELSPFVVVVKETLCELELPYRQVSVPRGSPRRQELFDKRGHFQVPYLEDPNRGVFLWESAAIVKYLNDTYAE